SAFGGGLLPEVGGSGKLAGIFRLARSAHDQDQSPLFAGWRAQGQRTQQRQAQGEKAEQWAALHGNPFQRRMPHSATKQPSTQRNTSGFCQRGSLQVSVIGAWRWGSFRAKSVSAARSMTSPPVRWARASSRARFGVRERNSSAAGSEAQPAAARPATSP